MLSPLSLLLYRLCHVVVILIFFVLYVIYVVLYLFVFSEDSKFFTIKLHHHGDFDENLNSYVGGEVSYFDMCSQLEFGIADLESMLNEVGIFLGKFCLWYCIPNTELDQGLLPIKDNDEVDSMIVLLCYSKCMNLYTTDNVIDYGADF